MQKTEMSNFPMYFWANSFVILKGKIGKEDAIFEKSLFCEKFLEYDFTWKKCWFQIEIQNLILMTHRTLHTPHTPPTPPRNSTSTRNRDRASTSQQALPDPK